MVKASRPLVTDHTGAATTTIGTVTVPMPNRIGGFAMTSHDPSALMSVSFDNAFVF
jgi:hypothetical protein